MRALTYLFVTLLAATTAMRQTRAPAGESEQKPMGGRR
jgi:hypothetical protein